MDVARSLIRLGHQPIVIYRRTRQEMPALFEEVEEAMEEASRDERFLSDIKATMEDFRYADAETARRLA